MEELELRTSGQAETSKEATRVPKQDARDLMETLIQDGATGKSMTLPEATAEAHTWLESGDSALQHTTLSWGDEPQQEEVMGNAPKPYHNICVVRANFFNTDEWQRKLCQLKDIITHPPPSIKTCIRHLAKRARADYVRTDFLQSRDPMIVIAPANLDFKSHLLREVKQMLADGALEYIFNRRKKEGQAVHLPAGYTRDWYHKDQSWYFLFSRARHDEDSSLRRIQDCFLDLASLIDTYQHKRVAMLMIKQAWDGHAPCQVAELLRVIFEHSLVQLTFHSVYLFDIV